ncbi:MAG: right-handed parallel beta-helix repeat-containing protein, partial [Bdellovibrionaceae bacterium]|nr:right-handed parallel beta-helix repeat-containing protein [Pseudobdellovibrionaceae bacterium]
GITFNGVGNKTLIDYVQVHRNSDDGVEFFGGTVDVKHLVLTENEDDSLDWDMGWVGRAQYLLMVQANDIADNGIEADNLKSPMNALPRSNPTISNMTIIGSPKSGYGMLLRRGTSASIMNSIVAGSGKGCVDIDDNETFKNNGVKITSTLFQCAKNFELEAGDLWSTEDLIKTDKTNLLMSADLNKHLPTATSPIFNKTTISDDLFFDEVSYIGAIESAKQDWTKGWTVGL